MPDALKANHIFKSNDPELLKKAVTEKVEKLINAQVKRQSQPQKSC